MVALFATERALAELAGLAMLALSLALPAVESFGALAALSLLAGVRVRVRPRAP